MPDLNEAIFRAINGWPSSLEPFMGFFAVATNYLGVRLALLALVIFLIWKGGKYRMTGISALIAFPIADGLTNFLKNVYPVARPCNVLADAIHHGVGCSNTMGTASAHSANMAAVALVFTYYLGRWGWPWIAIALITGISRVYHAAHYPAQVLAGWTCGLLVASLVIAVGQRLQKKPESVSVSEPDEKLPT